MPRAPEVIVPYHDENSRIDLSDAARFGRTRVIFHRELYPDDVDDRMPGVMRHARAHLAGFDPATDYLCLVGSPLYLAVCVAVLADRIRDPIRMLRYDRIEGAYYEVVLG